MYNFFCGTNQKNALQNEIKGLTFEVSNLSITFFFRIIYYEGPNIYNIHTERRRWGLEICHVFMHSTDFKQQIYCSFLWIGGGSKN